MLSAACYLLIWLLPRLSGVLRKKSLSKRGDPWVSWARGLISWFAR